MTELIHLEKTAHGPRRPTAPWITGTVAANGRTVPLIATRLTRADILGGWKVRWNIGRMGYIVLPGLYAAGTPTAESPVLVTANYKLTFDKVRSELQGISAWVLVLDTRGINVWCAAGKGTFGTSELVQRIAAVKLDAVVSHRTLILPQLGAPGVAAHQVRKETGWNVKYGPVLAKDIPAYLAAGMKKDEAMRRVPFAIAERMAIAPVELVQSWPLLAAILACAALLALPVTGPFAAGFASRFLQTLVPLVGAVLLGTLAFPALLPWLPTRAFAVKGAFLGAIWGLGSALVLGASLPRGAALVLLCAPITAFLAMNFTGSSTFTCQPGAALEVRRGLVPMIVSLVLGLGLRVAASVFAL